MLGQMPAHGSVDVGTKLLLVASAFAGPAGGGIVIEMDLLQGVGAFHICDISFARGFRLKIEHTILVVQLLAAAAGIRREPSEKVLGTLGVQKFVRLGHFY